MSGLREKMWLIIAVFLVLSLATGIVFLSIRLARQQPAEITLYDPRPLNSTENISIGGAVVRPGIYEAKPGDTLISIVSSAGVSDNADTGNISIYVPAKSESSQPQKVNLNRAEVWLLQALPGIGEGRARLIVDFRDKNGPFRNVDDLLKIQGFGTSVVDKIRDYATVVD
ncbi:MAG: ComEA family DNA-binding protein [Dehalococcoidia bacterium]|jgi:competence protein ComEA